MNTSRARPARHDRAYWAFWAHRLSGLALALFLPLHFYVLGLAIDGTEPLDRFLAIADNPLFKLAEWGLVTLLTLHLLLGLRLVLLDGLPPRPGDASRRRWIAPAMATALLVGMVFVASLTLA